ncbi:flagellar biosynthesis pathway [Alkalihalophilus pseudofirmus OF4]|uniref:Flagellar biosynthesis pathway n=2 Tax=Alkalihalophilus pseudofirmus TaxID=79885 RepID=D3FT54_ALKPO|nr:MULTISPECIES: EscU/YscU/HrcU family type III secretion system export apparatus switch protein [Alkalihalophilus]ADC48122.1 flagellar biosynthesis pathway [Alkalihalophilus pseudofirmus OF4]MDV2885291.1 EscU/YscU/HrcU family type III secretion system export apparatus switch protein [Alkalihalophilus pseudofirmus]MED1602271.1 EscU/YscU/HrcU family type III secretion system export apparatus switch protein [Alkalihalophilus marmarensis]
MNNELKKQAVALRYDAAKQDSPEVIAKGKGIIAEEIIEKAKNHHIPIQEDASLVELLSQLNINQTIPPELYEVVAEVFAFIYRVDKNSAKG